MVRNDNERDGARSEALQGHIAYWRSNSEEGQAWVSAGDRFEAGFNKGWADAGEGKNDESSAAAEHLAAIGDHPREWEFGHGYKSGQAARQ